MCVHVSNLNQQKQVTDKWTIKINWWPNYWPQKRLKCQNWFTSIVVVVVVFPLFVTVRGIEVTRHWSNPDFYSYQQSIAWFGTKNKCNWFSPLGRCAAALNPDLNLDFLIAIKADHSHSVNIISNSIVHQQSFAIVLIFRHQTISAWIWWDIWRLWCLPYKFSWTIIINITLNFIRYEKRFFIVFATIALCVNARTLSRSSRQAPYPSEGPISHYEDTQKPFAAYGPPPQQIVSIIRPVQRETVVAPSLPASLPLLDIPSPIILQTSHIPAESNAARNFMINFEIWSMFIPQLIYSICSTPTSISCCAKSTRSIAIAPNTNPTWCSPTTWVFFNDTVCLLIILLLSSDKIYFHHSDEKKQRSFQ